MGLSVVALLCKLLLVASLAAPALGVRSNLTESGGVDVSGGRLVVGDFDSGKACAEKSVDDVCICGHYSFKKGWQCSGCKDRKKWGYGCDLDCPSECFFGCDFS